ncbi:PQQ-dependent sugar dehydrogenase [Glycocaulis sp.]|uniref:PQQ-dependent sugar dehydrogenase n=1 Tax=Glycocaulis sp. TaxID=1969725 RepID=UPI003D214E4D
MILPLRTMLLTSSIIFASAPGLAQEAIEAGGQALALHTVATGLEHPWALAFITDDTYLVTERNSGALRSGNVNGTLSDPIWEADDLFRFEGETSRSQAGLFDVQLHPHFEENGWVYISYSRQTERGAALVVVRGTVSREDRDVTFSDVEDIFVMKEDDQDSSGLHFGGRMAFDPSDASLFLSVGERRNISRSQDASDQAGAVLRMTDSGEAHPDNPSFETEGDGELSDPYVYAIGVRNIQALAMRPGGGQLWAADHGPEGGDAIRHLASGTNHGWPFVTGGEDYSGAPLGVGEQMEGMTPAVHVFDETIAPSGLAFVTAESAFQDWSGNMLVGGLYAEGVVRVQLQGDVLASQQLIELGHRVRDVRNGPDGAIWMVTDHADGVVLRLVPEG